MRRIAASLGVLIVCALVAWMLLGRGSAPEPEGAGRTDDAAPDDAAPDDAAPDDAAPDDAAPDDAVLRGAGDVATVAPVTLPPPVDLDAVDRIHDLHGVVVDQDGQPVRGAHLVAIARPWQRGSVLTGRARYDEEERGPETYSATDGTFAIRLRRGTLRNLRVSATGFATIELGHVQPGELVRIVMRPGVSLLVAAVDEAGIGVAGCALRLFRPAWRGGATFARDGVTDESGVCRFADLPGGTSAWLEPKHPELAEPSWVDVGLPEEGEGEVEIVLTAGRTVTGVVTDAVTGKPIPGARVGTSWVFFEETRTGAEGRYALRACTDARASEVNAMAPGYARASEEASGRLVVDFALHRGHTLVGCVVTEARKPVANALVTAIGFEHHGSGQQISFDVGRTDADGRFRLEGLAGDLSHALVVMVPGHGRLRRLFAWAGTPDEPTDLGDLVLPAARLLAGRVVDVADMPVSRVALELQGPKDDAETPASVNHYGRTEQRCTDDLGRFTFTDLAAGAYTIEVRLPGAPFHRRSVTIPEGTDLEDVEIRLTRTSTYRVVVEAPDGTPVPGAYVTVQLANPNRGQAMFSVQTEEAGVAAFELDGPPGSASVWLSGEMGERWVQPGEVPWPAGAREHRIRLVEAVAVAGVVVNGKGEPLPSVELIVDRDGDELQMWTDREGRFRVQLAAGPPVDVRLTGNARGVGGSAPTQVTFQGLAGEATRVERGTVDLEIVAREMARDRSLSVLVLDLDGEPVEGAQVRTYPMLATGMPKTDATGRVELKGLIAQPLTLWIFAPSTETGTVYGTVKQEGVVPEGQEIVVRLRKALPLSGIVYGPDGEPIHGALVRVDVDRGGVATHTDQGSFRLIIQPDLLPATIVAEFRLPDGRVLEGRVDGVNHGTKDVSIQLR